MSFFVISKGDWGIRADVFMQQLRARWPAVTIREITSPDSNFCLDFDLALKHSRVDGSLHRTGRSFHFDSDLRDAAQLALWFRALAPSTEPLVFCDDAMSGMLDLGPTHDRGGHLPRLRLHTRASWVDELPSHRPGGLGHATAESRTTDA